MSRNAKVLLAFRYDDFSERSPTELEEAVIGLFRRLRLALTIGIIPYQRGNSGQLEPIGAEKAALVRIPASAGAVEVALHGYSHESAAKDRWGRDTEFSGVPYATQRQRLSQGRGLLEERTGATIHTFIPPWNSYDRATLTALAELGFRTLSAGRTGELDLRSELAFLPATARLADLRATAELGRSEGSGPIPIVVLFHDYDFVERDQRWGQLSFQEFATTLEWVAVQDDIGVVTIDQMARELPDLTASRYASFAAYHDSPLRRLLPSGWPGSLEDTLGAYLSEARILALRRRRTLRAAGLFVPAAAGSALAGIFVGGALLRFGPAWSVSAARYLGTGMLAVVLVLALRRDRKLYFRGLLALTIMLSAVAGLWFAF